MEGGIIGFEFSCGEEAVFLRDGRDADGMCKKDLGEKAWGWCWNEQGEERVPCQTSLAPPKGFDPGPNCSWGKSVQACQGALRCKFAGACCGTLMPSPNR